MTQGSDLTEIMLTEATGGGGSGKIPIKEKYLKRPAPTLSYGALVCLTYGTFPSEEEEVKKDS